AGRAVEGHAQRRVAAAERRTVEQHRLAAAVRFDIASAPLQRSTTPGKARHAGLRIGRIGAYRTDSGGSRFARQHIRGIDDETALDNADPSIAGAALVGAKGPGRWRRTVHPEGYATRRVATQLQGGHTAREAQRVAADPGGRRAQVDGHRI